MYGGWVTLKRVQIETTCVPMQQSLSLTLHVSCLFSQPGGAFGGGGACHLKGLAWIQCAGPSIQSRRVRIRPMIVRTKRKKKTGYSLELRLGPRKVIARFSFLLNVVKTIIYTRVEESTGGGCTRGTDRRHPLATSSPSTSPL